MVHPSVPVQDRWNEPGNLREMINSFATWDPLYVRVPKKIKECLKCNLVDSPLVDTWENKIRKGGLIGDASHAPPSIFIFPQYLWLIVVDSRCCNSSRRWNRSRRMHFSSHNSAGYSSLLVGI